VLEQKGAFLHDPKRKRKDPPTKGPLGDPPASLPIEMHATWVELAEDAPIGVPTRADRAMFEDMVRLKYERRHGTKWTMAQQGQLTRLYSLCGMTPSDRSKVNAAEADAPADPAEKYFN
jgi:hypothetical protein